MSFPDLQPLPSQRGKDAVYHTEAQGLADDGPNVFNTGLNPLLGIDPDKVDLVVQPVGPGVTGAEITSDVNPDTGEVEITFTGSGEVYVRCVQTHSTVW